MIGVLFTTEEVLAALAGTLTEIRRSMKPQPRPGRDGNGSLCYGGGNLPGGIGEVYHVWEAGPGVAFPLTLECQYRWEEHCPLGAPGTLLWGKERWALEDLGDGEQRVVWLADRAAAWCTGGPSIPLGSTFYMESGYEPTGRMPRASMPAWASRLAYMNRGVRIEQVDSVWTWVATVERVNRPDGSAMRPVEIVGAP